MPTTLHQPSVKESAVSPPSVEKNASLTKKSWPRQLGSAILAALVLLVVVESLARIIAVSEEARFSHYRMFDLKYYLALQPAEPRRKLVFFMGDSMMAFAAYPEQIISDLETQGIMVDARNLATHDGSPNMNIALLRTAIKAGNRPDYVLFNVSTRILNQSFSAKNEAFETSYLNQCWLQDTPDNPIRCWLEDNFYLIRFRSSLKTAIQDFPNSIFYSDQKLLSREKMKSYPIEDFSPKGWVPNYLAEPLKKMNKLYNLRYKQYIRGKLPLPDNIKPYQWTNEHILPILEFCKQEKIPLALVLIPEAPYPELYYAVRKTTRSQFLEKINTLANRWKIPFIDVQVPEIKPTDFGDEAHVNVRGSLLTSEALADELAGLLKRAD